MNRNTLPAYTPGFNRIVSVLLIAVLSLSVLGQEALDHKIGQMIMVSYAPDTPFEDTLYYDLEHRNLGGVIFFAYHLLNPPQIRDLTSKLQQKAATPLFIATDQEGGVVARLDENNGYTETHTAYELGTVIDEEDSTRQQARIMAEWLYDAGINVNLAPVVDVDVNPSSPAIGRHGRSFSADPMKVYDHAAWFISEFDYYDIISTLKHFPGHGSAVQDSHLGFTDITNTWSDSELVPYRELISAGYSDMIMIGHLYNAHIDSVHPASLSNKFIRGLLRRSLKFQGVVASDAMFMRAITENYSFEEAIVLAVNAGTDLLLYTTNEYNGVSLVAEVTRVIKENIELGIISAAQIDESYQRIMALKTRMTGVPAKHITAVPNTFGLEIFPNPFNATTTIELDIIKAGPASLEIFDIRGKLISRLFYPKLSAGKHRLGVDGADMASGIYFVKIRVAGYARSAKITLIR